MESTRQQTIQSQHSTLRESFLASDIAEKNENTRNDTTSSLAGLTLAAVLNNERIVSQSLSSNHHHNHSNHPHNSSVVRTLLDIIRNEETLSNPNSHIIGKKTWRSFKDRLKLKRATAGTRHWRSSVPVPQSDIDIPNSRSLQMSNLSTNWTMRNSLRNNSIRRGGSFNESAGIGTVPADDVVLRESENGDAVSGSMRLSAALAAEREETRRRLSREVQDDDADEEILAAAGDADGGQADEGGGGVGREMFVQPAQQPVRMSLMDLLEETDRQAGIQGPTYRLDDDEDGEDEEDEEEEEEEEEEVKGGGGKGEYSCCVCMVRHKGAAFIPCGHTFCRLCSRELWVQRGHCPLCNGFILEILDIF
ncbi:hypothetical protein Ancab_019863 [Ancistrocladus abbreviatus]